MTSRSANTTSRRRRNRGKASGPRPASARRTARRDDLLPSQADRERVADAVHRAIEERSWGRDIHPGCLCSYYAHAGAQVAAVVLGAPYRAAVGSIRVRVSRRWFWQVGAAGGPLDGQFHCWFMRDHGRRRVEVVDLTSRYYRELAETCGLPWDRRDVPDFVWGWADELFAEHRMRLEPDPRIADALYRQLAPSDWQRIDDIAEAAAGHASIASPHLRRR